METAEVRCVCHKRCRPTATSTGSTSLTNKRSLDYVRGHYLGGRGGTKLEGSLCPQYRHKLVSGSAEPGSGLLNRYSHLPYKCCTLHAAYLTLTALSVPYRPASQFMFTLLRWFFLRSISPLRQQILVLFPEKCGKLLLLHFCFLQQQQIFKIKKSNKNNQFVSLIPVYSRYFFTCSFCLSEISSTAPCKRFFCAVTMHL